MSLAKILIYPLLISIVSAPVFYSVVDKVGGVMFIAIFLGLFGGGAYLIGSILKIRLNILFALFVIALSVTSYLVSVFIGVASANYIMAMIVGNIIMALGMYIFDYFAYGHKIYPLAIYTLASIASIVGMYYINRYGDKSEIKYFFLLVYPVVLYLYLQASSVSHYMLILYANSVDD